MTEPDPRSTIPALDPLPSEPMSPPVTRAFFDVKAAGAMRPPGPGAEAPPVAELYQGMRDADADLAARVEAAAKAGDHSVSPAVAHDLVVYTFRCTVDAHLRALHETAPTARARLFGARNAYAVSYAQLALRDVEHMDAPDIADRLIEALDNGVRETPDLTAAAWNAPFPIDLHLHD